MSINEQLQTVKDAEFESLVSMADKMMNGFEKLVQLNLQALREAGQNATETMRATLAAKDLPGLMSAQAANPMQANGQRMMLYTQQLAEIAGSTQSELAGALNRSMVRMAQALQDTPQSGSGAAPVGGGDPAAMMQNLMNFTTQAFEVMQQSQKQASKMVSDSVQNLAQAASKAAEAAPKPSRKRAT